MNCELREIDPARLAWGYYDHDAEDYIDEGDIHGSYSADCIAEGQPVRKPFRFEGELWVTVGLSGSKQAEAYRLLPARLFPRTVTTYAAKVRPDHGEAARNDPHGFYDGMTVKHGGQTYVLCGPEVAFLESAAKAQPKQEQLGLFGVQEAA